VCLAVRGSEEQPSTDRMAAGGTMLAMLQGRRTWQIALIHDSMQYVMW
jgi:hypothetical protein